MHLTDAAKNIFRKKMWKNLGFITLKTQWHRSTFKNEGFDHLFLLFGIAKREVACNCLLWLFLNSLEIFVY